MSSIINPPGSGGGGGAPSGPAGGVLSGTYPNPSFAADQATQAELESYFGFAMTVAASEKTANYTLSAGDTAIPVAIHMNSASGTTLTVPTNATVAFAVGSCIEVVRMGAGTVTIAGDTGVTVRSAGGLLDLASQYSAAALRKIGTDEWLLTGDLA